MKEKIILKDLFKQMSKESLQLAKRFEELQSIFDKLNGRYESIMHIKANAKVSKAYTETLKEELAKSDLLDNYNVLIKEYFAFSETVEETKTNLKEMQTFLEKFRTKRTYQLNEKIIYRFLSGFLSDYAEFFYFKPEFIGVIDIDALAKEVSAVKENAKLKVKYTQLPKLIKYAYEHKLKNFVIEAHNLKMLFLPNYNVKITTENSFLRKIDLIAKENNIDSF